MIAEIKKRFSSRRKVDSEFAVTTSVGSLFQMCGAATTKVRLLTVDSLTDGITRRLVLGIDREEWLSSWQVVNTDQRTEVTRCIARENFVRQDSAY